LVYPTMASRSRSRILLHGYPQKLGRRITVDRFVSIETNAVALRGFLDIPDDPRGLVLFAHPSASSRFSARNDYLAYALREAQVGTLLFDLLTAEEERLDEDTRDLRFDILLLTRRLIAATHWAQAQPALSHLALGYFGAATGAAAALCAAACTPAIRAVVSRGGLPDLAGSALAEVRAPTLLIVGGRDQEVLAVNRKALAQLACEARLEILPGATHHFEEPGALEQVASVAAKWFVRHLAPPESSQLYEPCRTSTLSDSIVTGST
jgi:putative phosphoribosyl transferase